MAIVNGLGIRALNGVNGPLSLADGRILCSQAGLACFVEESSILFQDLRAGASIAVVNVVSGVINPVDGQGCNVLVAGAGVWAAGIGAPGSDGIAYRDSYGTTRTGWTPLAVDDLTGQVLVNIFNGYSSTVNQWDGIALGPAIYTGAPVLQGTSSADVAIVQVGASMVVLPSQGWASFPLIDFTLSLGWVVGWSPVYNGLVLWKGSTSPLGYLLAQDVTRFNADVAVQSDGHVWVVASTGAGELPGELITYDVDPVAHTVNGTAVGLYDLSQVSGPTPPPVDPPDPPQPPVGWHDVPGVFQQQGASGPVRLVVNGAVIVTWE